VPINTLRGGIDHRPLQSRRRSVKFIIALPVIYFTRRSTVLKSKNKQINKQTHQTVRLSNKLKQEMTDVRPLSASRRSQCGRHSGPSSQLTYLTLRGQVGGDVGTFAPAFRCLFIWFIPEQQRTKAKQIRTHADFINKVRMDAISASQNST